MDGVKKQTAPAAQSSSNMVFNFPPFDFILSTPRHIRERMYRDGVFDRPPEDPPMPNDPLLRPKRRPGGQPRNLNALKHGFYARSLTAKGRKELAQARISNDLEAEISLLRVKLKEQAADPDTLPQVLNSTARALAQLIATEYRIAPDRRFETVDQRWETQYGPKPVQADMDYE